MLTLKSTYDKNNLHAHANFIVERIRGYFGDETVFLSKSYSILCLLGLLESYSQKVAEDFNFLTNTDTL